MQCSIVTCNGQSLNIASVISRKLVKLKLLCPDMFCPDVLNCDGVLGRRAGVEHEERAPS